MTGTQLKLKNVEPQQFVPIPKKEDDDSVWCLYSGNPNTLEVTRVCCNDKAVIESLMKKKNRDLNCNTINKGPFLWNRREELPTYQQFAEM